MKQKHNPLLTATFPQLIVLTANGGTNLALGVNYNFAALPGLYRNESALGGALDTLALRAGTGTLGAAEQDLIAALALSDLTNVQASLSALNDSGFDADSLQALFTIGYAMGTDELTHGPFVGAEYQQVNIDGFSQGSGPVQVLVGDYDIDSLRGLIG